MERWYETFQHIGLVLAPFFYVGIYLLILQVAKAAIRTTIRTLAFALSILVGYVLMSQVPMLAPMMAYTILGLRLFRCHSRSQAGLSYGRYGCALSEVTLALLQ